MEDNKPAAAAAVEAALLRHPGIRLQLLKDRYPQGAEKQLIQALTGCQVVCILVGERPGLVTAESMSAYITYGPHTGIPESKRTVVSNIHRQGTPAVEAGAHIAQLLMKILEAKASGVDLLRGEVS